MKKKQKNPPRRTPEQKKRDRNKKLALQVGAIVLGIAVVVIAIVLLQPRPITQNMIPTENAAMRQHEETGIVEFLSELEYEGLTPGKTYTIEASLTDASGQVLTFGETFFMTANSFVPEQESGTLEVILIIPPTEVIVFADEIASSYITRTIREG